MPTNADNDSYNDNNDNDKCNDSGEEQEQARERDAFELVKFSERIYRADKIEYKISPVEDAVRKWCRSPDYRKINSFNEDESEMRDAEIDNFIDWIEHEREEQGIKKETRVDIFPRVPVKSPMLMWRDE